MKSIDKNLVLIGMPGCGKSTIGKMLSLTMKKDFIDIDTYIEKNTGMCINDIFKKGESCFRDIETNAVGCISKEENIIIATGGGVVKNPLNMQKLKENGIIIFIDRPIENIVQDITTEDRPLLNEGIQKLHKLFNERYNLYKEYCDIQIINDNELEEVLNIIIGALI